MDFDEWWKKQPTRVMAAGFKDDARMIWELATKAEREECAKVCDEIAEQYGQDGGHVADHCAIVMRANVKLRGG